MFILIGFTFVVEVYKIHKSFFNFMQRLPYFSDCITYNDAGKTQQYNIIKPIK